MVSNSTIINNTNNHSHLKAFHKRDGFNFPIVNFPLAFINLSWAFACTEYISLRWHDIPEIVFFQDLFDRVLLLITNKEEATGPTPACDHFEICTIAIMTVLNRHELFVS